MSIFDFMLETNKNIFLIKNYLIYLINLSNNAWQQKISNHHVIWKIDCIFWFNYPNSHAFFQFSIKTFDYQVLFNIGGCWQIKKLITLVLDNYLDTLEWPLLIMSMYITLFWSDMEWTYNHGINSITRF